MSLLLLWNAGVGVTPPVPVVVVGGRVRPRRFIKKRCRPVWEADPLWETVVINASAPLPSVVDDHVIMELLLCEVLDA